MWHSKPVQCVVTLILIAAALMACDMLPAAPVKPQPGATLVATIATDRAGTAQITLKVSDDSQAIAEVWGTFTNLTCEASAAGTQACASWQWGTWSFTDLNCQGFSAGRLSALVETDVPITEGRFEFQSRFIGEASGRFTSPTAAQGTIHLALFDGQVECGDWDWGTTGQ
jgi:hypothetical protein